MKIEDRCKELNNCDCEVFGELSVPFPWSDKDRQKL